MTMAIPTPRLRTISERAEDLRGALNHTQEGKAAMSHLAPPSMFHGDRNMVDFSDWSQFNQWPQSM